jgi:hypothetical protein
MPIHIAPHIRALEEALESDSLIPTLNSQGVTVKLAQEAASTQPKLVPVAQFRVIRGTKYTAS